MTNNGYSIDKDLKEALAMTDALKRYVRQDHLYGTVGSGGFFAGGKMPALTVGALLMRLRRLGMMAAQGKLSERQLAKLEQARQEHDEVAREWRVHYEAKMLREVNSRLDAMKPFFDECRQSQKLCARVYGPEALRRTIVEELMIAMEEHGMKDGTIVNKARKTDSTLRGFVVESSFVWDESLKPYYDDKRFWWLYNSPEDPDNG